MNARQPPGMRSRPPGRTHKARVGECLIAIFCLGAVLFSPLVIGIFDRGAAVTIFGVPLLYFYLFGAWALLIILLALVMEGSAEARRGPRPESAREPSNGHGEMR